VIIVNLQQLGPVPPRFCSAEELACVWETSQEIMATTPEAVLEEILTEWQTALTWDSMSSEPVSEEWYYRALLVTCMRGLRGEMRPVFWSLTK